MRRTETEGSDRTALFSKEAVPQRRPQSKLSIGVV